jgi:hypothetical protein
MIWSEKSATPAFAGAGIFGIMREEGPMARNRFEEVDELQSDAINLTLIQKSDGQVGIIHCPKTAAPDRLPADLTSEEIPARDAVVGAIHLANSNKIPIVVIDRDHIWKSEWGDLWRYEEEGDSEGAQE